MDPPSQPVPMSAKDGFVSSISFNASTGAAQIKQKLISIGSGEHLKTMWGFPNFPGASPALLDAVATVSSLVPRALNFPKPAINTLSYSSFWHHLILASFFRSSTTAMPFGILNPRNSVEHVQGTSLLQVDSLEEAEEAPGLERGTGKHAKTILIPQPSQDPNDPLRWPLWQRDLMFLLYLYCTILCAGGSVITTMNGPTEQVS